MKRTKSSNNKIALEKTRVITTQSPRRKSPALALILSGLSVLSCIFYYPQENQILLSEIFHFTVFLFAGLSTVLIFLSAFNKNARLLKLLFLIIIFGIILIAITQQYSLKIKDEMLYFSLTYFLEVLTGPFVIIGVLTLWLHKEKINQFFSISEKSLQADRTKLFFKLLFGKNEIIYTSLFILIIGISTYNLFNRLDDFDLYSDEAQVTQGAAGYLYSGEYRQYNFATDRIDSTKFYNRAKPHQFILAQSYKIFGISNWSSRFPSALFGVFMIMISYFIARSFTKDKLAALLIVFSFAFFYEFLALQRWTRMYAILFPFFLLSFYFAYKFLCESKIPQFLKQNSFIKKFLDYNYTAFFLFIMFFYTTYKLHENSLILLPILFLFSIILFIKYRKMKHLIVIAAGIFVILIQLIFPFDVPYRWISLFKINHYDLYSQLFLYYPHAMETNIIILLIGVGLLFFIKNEEYFNKTLLLLLSIFTSIILFSFVIDFNVAYRYMSFLAPIVIIYIIGSLFFVIKVLFRNFILYSVTGLIIFSILIQFAFKYDDLYVKNPISPAKPSKAWRVINQNYKPGEALFLHWGPTFYLDSINPNVRILDLFSFRDDKFSDVLDSMNNYKAGWITWHTHNGDYIHKKLREYSRLYLKKYHGYGIDSTGVEVYYYTDTMLRSYDQYLAERTFPVANLSVENPFSFAFFFKVNETNQGEPFFFSSDSLNIKTVLDKDHHLIFKYSNQNRDSVFVNIPLNQKNHVVIFQSGANAGNKFGIYLNGKLVTDQILSENIKGLLKFKINPVFTGYLNDLRYYNFVLNNNQISQIIKADSRFGSATLKSNKKDFSTLFHWQK